MRARRTRILLFLFKPPSRNHESRNISGQIVGNYYDFRQEHGFLLSGGNLITLNMAYANAINDAGQIVGDDLLLSGGIYHTINVPGTFTTEAEGIKTLVQH